MAYDIIGSTTYTLSLPVWLDAEYHYMSSHHKKHADNPKQLYAAVTSITRN